ncbi:baeRF12 domain-containing protein [Shinella sumterensis]|uniref:baeRF12 domain-containing protein n=1 Tax=Shinella sumterensis TaxID=1967501 RepID=UPI003F829DD7
MILPNGATVAVVNGRTMLLFQNIGHELDIELSIVPPRHVDDRHAGSGGRHRRSAANPDARRLAEDDFAVAASSVLNRAAIIGEIDGLLLIADPRTLGEMRRHFHKSLRGVLLGEIVKDMTNNSVTEIEAAIRAA